MGGKTIRPVDPRVLATSLAQALRERVHDHALRLAATGPSIHSKERPQAQLPGVRGRSCSSRP